MTHPGDGQDFLVRVGWVIEFHAVENLAAGQHDTTCTWMGIVTATLRVNVFDPAEDRMLQLTFFEVETRTLLVVVTVVSDPMFAQDRLAKPRGPFLFVSLVTLVVLGKLPLQPLKTMGGGSQSYDRFARGEIVLDVLHLVVLKRLKSSEEDHQVGRLQRSQAGDVIAARLDGAILGVGGDEEAALEAVMPGHNASQSR